MSPETPESFQISPPEEDLWASEPDGPAARTQAVLEIAGEVNASAIEDALRLAVRRHETLRTTFARKPGLTFPLQVVNSQLEPRVQTLDLSHIERRERAERAARVRQSELEAPFDLEEGPLVRAMLVIKGEGVYELIVTLSA